MVFLVLGAFVLFLLHTAGSDAERRAIKIRVAIGFCIPIAIAVLLMLLAPAPPPPPPPWGDPWDHLDAASRLGLDAPTRHLMGH